MKKDVPLLSDSEDLICLSALLREVLAEERGPHFRVPRTEQRPHEGPLRRTPRADECPPPTIHPAARLRPEPLSDLWRDAVA